MEPNCAISETFTSAQNVHVNNIHIVCYKPLLFGAEILCIIFIADNKPMNL